MLPDTVALGFRTESWLQGSTNKYIISQRKTKPGPVCLTACLASGPRHSFHHLICSSPPTQRQKRAVHMQLHLQWAPFLSFIHRPAEISQIWLYTLAITHQIRLPELHIKLFNTMLADKKKRQVVKRQETTRHPFSFFILFPHLQMLIVNHTWKWRNTLGISLWLNSREEYEFIWTSCTYNSLNLLWSFFAVSINKFSGWKKRCEVQTELPGITINISNLLLSIVQHIHTYTHILCSPAYSQSTHQEHCSCDGDIIGLCCATKEKTHSINSEPMAILAFHPFFKVEPEHLFNHLSPLNHFYWHITCLRNPRPITRNDFLDGWICFWNLTSMPISLLLP